MVQNQLVAAVPAGVYARAQWSAENRRKVLEETAEKNARKEMMRARAQAQYALVQNNRNRSAGRDRAAVEACKDRKWLSSQADRFELMEDIRVTTMSGQLAVESKVRLAKAASAGKVAAARAACLEKKRQARREEGRHQQFALAEKARRQAMLREEHLKRYASKFVPAGGDWVHSQLHKYSPLYREGASSTAALLLQHTLSNSGSPGSPERRLLEMSAQSSPSYSMSYS
jgi:hypothetical protein